MPADQKRSVLTHYLIAALEDDASDANSDGKLTVQESYKYIKERVETYVDKKFNMKQNPIFVNNARNGKPLLNSLAIFRARGLLLRLDRRAPRPLLGTRSR